ncbi:hypothetical protein SAV14893_047150 [Streptomyces avermitilis]|uniref:Uncharacterized protein n=1 Tax=Streptomyces avermitilis TaxID=33903 RepID=A0A4D4MTL7_STRAX|nr:hypothetical protein SAVMC3_59390 [Streptomyces avermitilis]GDY65322.1 hypothetical protein SAV14893_047150 [Streptomyces avermitilis]GDY74467.1 hypothetical protein SAV31267_039520 [Streptomyces avermitilis]GDY83516.1 hypothetical protein SAVCW2_27150 [Streptomyces avermitilis]
MSYVSRVVPVAGTEAPAASKQGMGQKGQTFHGRFHWHMELIRQGAQNASIACCVAIPACLQRSYSLDP